MKHPDTTVGEYGIRPAGSPNHCFYCNELKGGNHKPDCVVLQRSVMVEVKVKMVMMVPDNWDQSRVDFHLSNICCGNILNSIARLAERTDDQCLCGTDEVTAVYVSEATADDEERNQLFVKDQSR